MTGVLLLSKNNCYADKNDGVDWGPKEDKQWLADFIKDKDVFIGHKTYELIKDYKSLQPRSWQLVHPMNATVHFGGPSTFKKFPPEKLIVHQTYNSIDGKAFDTDWLAANYSVISTNTLDTYKEYIYEKKK